jgi:hypothetical protein
MKSLPLVTIACLMIAISCGSDKKNNDNAVSSLNISHLAAQIPQLKKGWAIDSIDEGENYIFPIIATVEDVPQKVSDVIKEHRVVLKTDGDLIYYYTEYEHEIRGASKSSDRWVFLKKRDAARIEEFITSLQGPILKGSLLTAKFPMNRSIRNTNNEIIFKSSSIATSTMDITKPLCDFDSEISDISVYHMTNSGTTILENLKRTRKSWCRKSYSDTDLKSIDLTDITFCDQTLPEDDEMSEVCQSNMDLSYLTQT